MDRCPCASAVAGAFVLAPTVYVGIEARTFFGLSAFGLARAAEAGNAFAVLVVGVWCAALLLGLIWAIAGYRATLNHVDAVDGLSAAYSALVLAGCWWLLQNVLSPPGGLNIEIGRAAVLAFGASSVVNIYLALRGLWPGKLPLRVPAQHHPAPGILLEMRGRIERMSAERDELAREVARLSLSRSADVAAFVELLGGRRKVLAWLHPDGRKEADKLAATAQFQNVSAVLDRIGVR